MDDFVDVVILVDVAFRLKGIFADFKFLFNFFVLFMVVFG